MVTAQGGIFGWVAGSRGFLDALARSTARRPRTSERR
jgi:hypothetical protein